MNVVVVASSKNKHELVTRLNQIISTIACTVKCNENKTNVNHLGVASPFLRPVYLDATAPDEIGANLLFLACIPSRKPFLNSRKTILK
jgi:hypothetical protein